MTRTEIQYNARLRTGYPGTWSAKAQAGLYTENCVQRILS